jgi:hypothetical protein
MNALRMSRVQIVFFRFIFFVCSTAILLCWIEKVVSTLSETQKLICRAGCAPKTTLGKQTSLLSFFGFGSYPITLHVRRHENDWSKNFEKCKTAFVEIGTFY